MQILALFSLLVFPFIVGIAAEDGPPDPIDRSKCNNTPSAQGNFLLKVVIPTLNKLIEFCEWAFHKIQALDPNDEAGGISDSVRIELKEEITDEVLVDVREQVRRGSEAESMETTADGSDDLFDENGSDNDGADVGASREPGNSSRTDTGMMQDMQALGPLLQDLDSRAAENLGEADLADPVALREATDEELLQINYLTEDELEKIRDVYPYEEDEE